MARIQTYPQDSVIEDSDKLVGTDGTVGSSLNKTKNFTVGELYNYTLDKIALDTIEMNPIYDQQAIVINSAGGAPNGVVRINTPADGVGLYAYCSEGNSITAETEVGTAITATSTGIGTSISVVNGGIVVTGTANTNGYQLKLSLNSAAKPSSNTWTIASDQRLKININPYTKGLDAILAINPVTYDYNGKGGFDATVTGNIGVIAQDVIGIIPESIKTFNAKLNEEDTETTELYNFDSHALTFMLINAIKELKAEIELLKQR